MTKSSLLFIGLCLALTSASESNLPQSCSSLTTWKKPVVPGARIISISSERRTNFTINGNQRLLGELNFCDVKVTLKHPGANDRVEVRVWLPTEDWNGRFQATGGMGFATGVMEEALGPAVKAGYAAASTDGGNPNGPGYDIGLSWVLKEDKSIDWDLLQNFASRSTADMVYVGKSITAQFYEKKEFRSYFNGCSGGGRQGFVLAQNYPRLVDGILAGAPAFPMPALLMSSFWADLVMKESGAHITDDDLNFVSRAVMDECDLLDGVKDQVITDPDACTFNLKKLVDSTTNGYDSLTSEKLDAIERIIRGPQSPYGTSLGFGIPWGGGLTVPVIINDSRMSPHWIRYLILRDPSFNTSSIGYSEYMALWVQAEREYNYLLGHENPDLSGFRGAGGKLLTWHGLSDHLIPASNSVAYRKRVEREMGGTHKVNEFYRLFLAPGVAHCWGGRGPQPLDPLEALVDWVEKDEPPETLDSATTNPMGELITRDVCLYPRKSKYMGIGDPNRASSWSCEGGDDDMMEEEINSPKEFLEGLKQRFLGLGLI